MLYKFVSALLTVTRTALETIVAQGKGSYLVSYFKISRC